MAQSAKKISCFNPGPAKLPLEVLQQAQAEMLDYGGLGLSVMEMSHRSKEFIKIVADTEQHLRDLLKIPSNYKVLFLQGGGTGQFAAVPLNLGRGENPTFDYFVTGTWSAKAAKEAEKYGKVNRVLPKTDQYTGIADKSQWKLDPNASYVYYCGNETVHGVEFSFIPDTGDVPLVCDMSSHFLTEAVDVSKFAAIIAGAQKNFGPAGTTVVIVREDMIGRASPQCPIVWDYKIQAEQNSCYNTPPVYGIYMVGLVFKWLLKNGGVAEMDQRCRTKQGCVLEVVDKSGGFYVTPVEKGCRSRVNIPVLIGGPKGDKELEAKFVGEATAAGLIGLKGHRSVGGLRISLYNAVSLEDVDRLIAFMTSFQTANKK